jgi:hypothetical protein
MRARGNASGPWLVGSIEIEDPCKDTTEFADRNRRDMIAPDGIVRVMTRGHRAATG